MHFTIQCRQEEAWKGEVCNATAAASPKYRLYLSIPHALDHPSRHAGTARAPFPSFLPESATETIRLDLDFSGQRLTAPWFDS